MRRFRLTGSACSSPPNRAGGAVANLGDTCGRRCCPTRRLAQGRRHRAVLPARRSDCLLPADAGRPTTRLRSTGWRRAAATHLWPWQPRGVRCAARWPNPVRGRPRSLHGVFRRQWSGELPLRSRSRAPQRQTALFRRHRVRDRRPAGPIYFGTRGPGPGVTAERRVCRPGGRTPDGSLAGFLSGRCHVAVGLYRLATGEALPEKALAPAAKQSSRFWCSRDQFPNAFLRRWAIARAPTCCA